MKREDKTRIQHMLDAALDIANFINGKSRKDLDDDRMLTLAITKSVEIIGEAASRVSESVMNENPDIPWAIIIAMRNRLIHGYYEIDMDRVWDTITNDLPPFISRLKVILLQQT